MLDKNQLGPPTLHELPPMQQFMAVFKTKGFFLLNVNNMNHILCYSRDKVFLYKINI